MIEDRLLIGFFTISLKIIILGISPLVIKVTFLKIQILCLKCKHGLLSIKLDCHLKIAFHKTHV